MAIQISAKIHTEDFIIWILKEGVTYVERSDMWKLKDGSIILFEDLKYQYRKYAKSARQKKQAV